MELMKEKRQEIIVERRKSLQNIMLLQGEERIK